MKSYVVNVTKECIKRGVASDSSACPIARAITKLRIPGLLPDVNEGSHLATFETNAMLGGRNALKVRNKKKKRQIDRFIESFDDYKPVKPFKFIAYLNKESD